MKHVVLFSPIPYAFLHQRPQKLADQFCAMGMMVTYVEPSGLREYIDGTRSGTIRAFFGSLAYHLLGLAALLVPPLARKPNRTTHRQFTPGTREIIVLPIVIPHNRFGWSLLRTLNAAVYRQVLRTRVLKCVGDESIALVENPFFGAVIRQGDFSKVYYDCIDELSLYAGNNPLHFYADFENRLVGMCSALFATAATLEEDLHARYPRKHVVRVPNGVDAPWFEEQVRRKPPPPDILRMKRPRIGYVGAIYSWLDYDLITKAALFHKDASFVLVGPVEDLKPRTLPNIYWTGRCDYDAIPGYIQSFDVCIIPFQAGKISRTTNPVKVYEYFALGKPVVTTPLKELEHYRDAGLVYMAENAGQFLEGLSMALAEPDGAKSEMRKEIARENSWQKHAAVMAGVFGWGND